MDTDQVGQRLEVEYCRGLLWDNFFLLSSLMTLMNKLLCEISKFGDETKIASSINTLNDARTLQRNLEKLVAWENRWEMKINVNKCRVMPIRKRNLEF